MHTGRVAHVANLPACAEVIGPMEEVCPGEMFTDSSGMQPFCMPRAMSESDIDHAVGEFVQAARLAMTAGFDGVELHAANGYLIEQFLNPVVNRRTDAYGGSAENRNRFAFEVVRATAAAIGEARVGIRLSPHGVFNGMGAFADLPSQYIALVEEFSRLKLVYVHLVDHSAMGAPPVPADLKQALRRHFDGVFILAGGFDRRSAELALAEDRADLIAFGRPFIANPDLIARMRGEFPLSVPDATTFYVPGAKGYTDYPVFSG
jgi:N-ethylmaleimide reductase